MSVTEWQYFPRSTVLPDHLGDLLQALELGFSEIQSIQGALTSNAVLEVLRPHMEALDYQVERQNPRVKVSRPVLFGRRGTVEKSFEVDAFHPPTGTVVEIEAGQGVINYKFLKDFFECLCIQDANFLVIGVLNEYKPPSKKGSVGNKDFDTVVTFFDSLFASQRFTSPLHGILIVGYDNL